MTRERRPDDRDRGGRHRWSVLSTLLGTELRLMLRDTRTILIAVLAPLLLFPVLLFVSRMVEESDEARLEDRTYTWAVTGDLSPLGAELVQGALALPPPDDAETDDVAEPSARFELRAFPLPADAPEAAVDSVLQARDLDVVVRAMSPETARAVRAAEDEADEPDEAAETEQADTPAGGLRGPGFEGVQAAADTAAPAADTPVAVPVLRLQYRASSDFGRRAAQILEERLERLREQRRDSAYAARGFPVPPDRVGLLDAENTATAGEEGAASLGLWLTPVLLLLILTGGSLVAADSISGEKERGTLETLLTTAAHRREIVSAKLMAVAVVGLAVALVNTLNLLVYVVFGVIELPAGFALDLSVGDVGLVLLLLLPLVFLVAAALLLLSGRSNSYKEYQIYFFPLFLAFLVPSLAAALPGMELRSAVAFVPITGVAVAVREILLGDLDPLFLAVAFLSSAGAAAFLVRRTESALSTERLIGGADLDEADLRGGPDLFRKHVLRWFGVLWAVSFLVSLWFGDELGLRNQALVNLVGIFLGGALLMAWRYGLDFRQAFALRRPHPLVWLAVLIGAPSALVTGVGLAELVNTWVFPVPEEVLRSFGDTMTVDEFPLWQLLLFLALMPAVLEELAFRGVLLHGLRRTFRPVALCLVTGLIFGLFHVSLFRIVPTAWLGSILAGVVLLTGSIYPAMLWHFLNNAVALVPARLGWVDFGEGLPAWAYPVAAAGLLTTFALLWVTRRPYPGLRRRRPPELGAGEASSGAARWSPAGTGERG